MKTIVTSSCSRIAALALLLLFCTSGLYSQGITSAAINGLVSEANGLPLPGTNIVAVHVPSGTTYGTSTRVDGRYNIPNLRVGGPYTVTASYLGYTKQVREGVSLQLSQNLELDFQLSEEAVQGQEVVVVGQQNALFSSSTTGAATNVAREQIDRLPSISRNFQDYYKLSPYLAGSSVSGSAGGNALGRNSKYNNIQIDGANFNDLFGLGGTGAPAGQSNVTPISLDAIEEFQIVVSPYDVRQSGFTGAGINAITRGGTNQYKGSAFYFGRSEGFAGKSPDTQKKKLDGFSDYQLGGRVGGPIIEDKLFFFANGEITRFKQPFSRTFGNQTIGTNSYTVIQDSLNLLTNYLMSAYGYDPGSWTTISPIRESDKVFLRLDYNLSQGHKLTARWNFLRSTEDNTPSRGRAPTDIYAANGRYKLDNKTHSLALQLSSVFSNEISNELTLGYVDQFDNPLYYGSPFPTLYINTSNPSATDMSTQKLVLGAEQFRHRNELGQKYFEITNNLSWYLQGHTVLVGAKLDLLKFDNLFINDNFGVYSYNSIAEFLANTSPSSYSFRYSATMDPLQRAGWGANQFGFYAQDEWQVNPDLKITGGVRFDIPTYPDKPNYNARFDSTFGLRTDETPKTAVAVSPRLGFNWALDEERSAQIRGGAGIFYGRFPYVWVSNQYSNTGVDFFTVTTRPAMFNPDPNGQAKLPPSSTTAEVDITDRNFKAPSIIRYDLALDYKLPEYFTATLEGIFSTTQNDIVYQNINLKGQQDNSGLTAGGVLAGESRPVWGIYNSGTRRYSTQWVDNQFSPGAFLIKNTDEGSNANITVKVERNAPDGINGFVSYTWGRAKDINSGNSATASSGWRFNPTQGNPNMPQLSFSQYDRTHRIIATVSYRFDWNWNGLATTLGIFYSGQSGRAFSYLVSGDVNGDGRSDNDLAYIPRDANDIILVNSSGTVLPPTDPAYAALMAYVNGDDYLNDNKGKISERSGPREPWGHQIDLRLAQEIPTIAGQRFEITFDILNVLNLLNSDWGWQRNVGVNQTVNLMSFHSIETTPGANYGKPRYQWQGLSDPFVPDNIFSRWQAQLGIRYTF